MGSASQIKDHMEVLGSDGQHVGTVDHMEGQDRIKLTRSEPSSQSQHHYIPVDWVDHVDEHVHLNKSAGEATRQWQAGA
jgi:hypothetical protein